MASVSLSWRTLYNTQQPKLREYLSSSSSLSNLSVVLVLVLYYCTYILSLFRVCNSLPLIPSRITNQTLLSLKLKTKLGHQRSAAGRLSSLNRASACYCGDLAWRNFSCPWYSWQILRAPARDRELYSRLTCVWHNILARELCHNWISEINTDSNSWSSITLRVLRRVEGGFIYE